MRKIKDKILYLRNLGYNYNQISSELKCSKGAISYHLNANSKNKSKQRTREYRKKLHPYVVKLRHFVERKFNSGKNHNAFNKAKNVFYRKFCSFFQNSGDKVSNKTFSIEDIIEKFGENPSCYLTGVAIDISKPKTYSFDHIIPISRGGDNSLENLGICTKEANQAKNNMTPEEFIEFCQKVVNFNQTKSITL